MGWLAKFLFGDITKIFITVLIALVAMIVIPNYNQILERFGFETRTSLKVKLNQEENNTNVAVDANQNMVNTIDTLEKTAKNVDDAINNHIEQNKKTDTKVSAIKKKKDSRIDVVQGASDKTPEQKMLEIDQVEIDSIWEAYCGFNNDTQCTMSTTQGVTT